MTRISIVGATLYGNRGAEAMLTTIIGKISERDPDTLINIYSYYPVNDKELLHRSTVNIYSLTPLYISTVLFPLSVLISFLKYLNLGSMIKLFPESLIALEQSDILIDIFGVSFMDGRVKYLPFNILSILPAMLLGVPVVKFSQAMGPFTNPVNKKLAKIFLPRIKKIFARGDITYRYVKDLDVPANVLDMAADLVFLHKPDYSLTIENEEYVSQIVKLIEDAKNSRRKLIGFCPSAVLASKARKEGWNYPELVYKIIKKLISEGYQVLLFPNATREKSMKKMRNNDLPVITNVVEYFSAFDEFHDNLFFISRDINTRSIKNIIGKCDIIIASRFHAMINSLSLQKPTFILGWGHKYFEVMEQFELHECVLDYKKKDIEYIIDKINTFIEKADNIQNNIETLLPAVEKMSNRQFEFIYDFLKI